MRPKFPGKAFAWTLDNLLTILYNGQHTSTRGGTKLRNRPHSAGPATAQGHGYRNKLSVLISTHETCSDALKPTRGSPMKNAGHTTVLQIHLGPGKSKHLPRNLPSTVPKNLLSDRLVLQIQLAPDQDYFQGRKPGFE